ncbi:MAG: SDR family NAD(P)-dependent oxidoreductase [Jatrophihabitantaceae bacterium]
MTNQTEYPVSDSDIAIVGMSGQFPGAADVGELWANIRAGKSGISRFSDEELRAAGVAESLLSDASYVKAGAVLDGIELFDAGFFGVGPKEAQILDPQQRLFLENSWHALEDAGCDPSRFDGSIGVFGGAAWSSYLQHNLLPSQAAAAMGELAVGLANDKDSLPLRVAHTLSLTGPAYGIQSYCSTSLVAVCAAASSLAGFECDLALAGGVAVSVPHRVGYLYQQGSIAPPDGECRAFDAAGLGAPLGSGVGVVVLRRLADALADGDQIYAVIRGWSVNNDGGRKVGFTAPGVQGQAAVIAEALASADLTAADIDYVEAHGTGTALGDASEIAALQQVFRGEQCLIGSIKTNLGHLDRAAGVTGLIKTSLALRNGEIPATRNLTEPNPQLRTGEAQLEVVTSLRSWPRQAEHSRRAGVSAFGIGGTNAHVVLEEAPVIERPAAAARPELLVWSARSATAADELTDRLAQHLDGFAGAGSAESHLDGFAGAGSAAPHLGDSELRLADVAHTLQAGRRAFEHRRMLVASTVADAAAGLAAGQALAGQPGQDRVALLIADAAGHCPAVIADRYATEPGYRVAVDECQAILGELGVAEADRPAGFVADYALASLLTSWGIVPAAVSGRGAGGCLAAHLAGVLSLSDALALAHRLHTGQLSAGWIAERLQLNAPSVPLLAATGEPVAADQAQDPAYWAVELRASSTPIANSLAEQGFAVLELGPAAAGSATLSVLPCADDPAEAALLLAEAVGRLWLAGVPVDWAGYRAGREVGKVALPGYPFQRQRYWIAAPAATAEPAAAKTEQPSTKQPSTGQPNADQPNADRDGHVQLLRPNWVEAAAPARSDTGGYLLIGGPAGLTGRLATALTAAGNEVTVLSEVPPATGGATVVDLRLLTDASPTGPARPAGSTASAKPADPASVVLPLAELISACAADTATTTELVVVTRGGQPITGAAVPAHAAAAALPVVANQEYLNLQARAVDLDPAAGDDEAVSALAGELSAVPSELLVAYRAGRRLVREFVAAEQSAPAVPALRAGGSYLITGGLGEVGLLLAEYLAERGAARLVLASRSGLAESDARYPRIERLRAAGTEVVLPKVDVTDVAGMRAVVADAAAAGRLDGVFHAAAQTGPETFRPLRDLTPELVGLHFGAKVAGAEVLAEVLAELDPAQAPEFCVLFTSTSAILGGLAFGSYAAANAALAAFAPAEPVADWTATRWIAAHWDTWAATLQRLGDGVGASMSAHSMSAEQGLAALAALLDQPAPSVLVAAGGLADRLPRLTGPAEPAVPAVPVTERFPRPDLPQPYTPPLTATERTLAELWSSVIGVEPVGTRDNFFDLSGNSLLALQMLALVKQNFGIAVPSVALFEAPTVAALAAVLDDKRGAGRPAAEPAQQVKPAAVQPSAVQPSAVQPVKPTATVQPAGSEPVRPAASQAVVRQVAENEEDLDRRIAVVGLAGRFPGAGDVGTFWQNLCGGVESISFFSPDELRAAGVPQQLIDDPSYVPARPVLDDIAGFDAAFFGISPRMAALTDPQQRLFLEVCWEGLEQAGYAAPEHRGRVGVYGGTNLSTYLLQMPEGSVTGGDVSTYEIIMGNEKDALTTTVSYLFGLYGPSVAVQTFCSTSLVATHLAVQALRNGECELALAGGVSIRVPNRVGHIFGPGGQESPDGHVRTFDAQARGSMFGDGAAVVVLKRLTDALRDGDHIWSVIRGSAMNNDGALKVGYTAPSVVGQTRVIADAMVDARVTGDDVSYIEAHGTATELGDPIEVAALTRAFGETSAQQYCPIGSVKTNVGHLDRAAGVTGLIKTSMALHEQVIPATLHYTSPNPEIDFAASPFYVNAELASWQTRDGRPRIAGINSLGMGGTNVHVVVQQAPVRQLELPADRPRRRYQVLPLSARTEQAVTEACGRLAAHLGGSPDARLMDVAFTLQAGRKTFEHRRVTVATSVAQAVDALAGSTPDAALLSRVDTVHGRPVALLFAGAGEQYPGLITELYQREPDFQAALDECLELLRPLLPETDLAGLLAGGRVAAAGLAALLGRGGDGAGQDPRTAELARTEVVQPALFAVEYALARTLLGWGLQPRVMAGYSLGEYVAACLAGVLSLPDAIALVARRARLIGSLPAGAMLAVSLPLAELERRFLATEPELDVAAVNGPQVTVLAGPVPAVQRFAERLRAAEIGCRQLQTTHAFHSRMLEPVSAELTEWISQHITLNPPRLPYLSNVTGDYADAALVCDPAYWAKHMCGPVQFAATVQTLLADPEQAILEIGPGQSLGALIRTAGATPQQWPLILAALPGGSDSRPADAALTDCLARLWLLGVELDWSAYHGRRPGLDGDSAELPGRIPLPTYPFQRQRYWIEGKPAGQPAALDLAQLPEGEITLDHIGALPTLPPEQWLYLPVWRQTGAPEPAEQQPASWLVYTQDGVAEQVLAALRPTLNGARLVLVRPGDAFAATEDGFTIRPGNLPDTVALLRQLRATGTELDRVLHLWALEPAPEETIVAAGLHTLVALARAAGEFGMDGWSLDVVVSGSQQVLDDDVAHPSAATLLGPVRVIPLEYPNVSTRLVDLDPAPAPRALAALVAELRGARSDVLVSLRHGRRWLPEYEPMRAAQPLASELLREGGVYLITGGLGGIALAMAERLARDCRAKLVLLARTGLPERDSWPRLLAEGAGTGQTGAQRELERIAKVSALLELGAEVEIVTGDVSDPDDARRAYETAIERFGALHGVLHTAGVPAMGLMQFKQPDELDQVLSPKVAGTLALLDALRVGKPEEHQLDFLVIFSSITSATGGGPGQVDYCAANAFCDSIAGQLATAERRVLAVDWGEWAWNAWEDGLAGYAEELQEFFRANRARIGIDFEQGWQSLLRALGSGESRVVINTQDFGLMVRYSSRFTVAAVTSPALGADAEARHPRPELVTPYQEPAGEVELAIAEIWCDALRLERLGVRDNFFELGGNSLLGVSIVAALRRQFAPVELPPHILYEAPTVAALGAVIEAELSGAGPSGAGAGSDEGSQVRAQLRRSGLHASAVRRRGR